MAQDKDQNHEIYDLYLKGLSAQRGQNREFWLNSAFLSGKQWIHFNPVTRRLAELPTTDQVRATINRLWPDSRTITSKLLQRPLVFEVIPNSADDVAIEGAKIGDSILHAVSREHNWESLRESAAWSGWKGGTAAICVDWDPAKGKPTALAEDGRLLPSGDTVETPLSVAEFVVQPGVREAETAYWWIKAEALPPEFVKAKYNLSYTPDADATNGLSSLEKSLVASQAGGSHGGPGGVSAPTNVKLCLVLTYYERPNPNRNKGRVEVVVNQKTIWGPKDWPFPFVDYLNFATCRETLVENTWLGNTVMSAARPVQAAYNAAWSNILQHADIAGNARLLTPQSAVELAEQYSDVIGEQVIYLDGADKPAWLTPPSLPGWLIQMPEQLSEQIDDLLGVHDVSRGSAPVNLESGYALAILAEMDSTPVGKFSASMARMFSKVASMVLKLYEDNVTEKRTAVIQSPGMPPQTIPWSGKDLAGQTEADVPYELVAPRSRAAQGQFAEKALQMGLITSIEELTRLAEVPGEREIITAVAPDVAYARHENAWMAQGRVLYPENFENHAKHIQEHNVFRKSVRYHNLSPELKAIFAAHVQAHEVLAAEEAGRAQSMAQNAGPAGSASPKADGSEMLPVSETPVGPGPAEAIPAPPPGPEQLSLPLDDQQAPPQPMEGAMFDQQPMTREMLLQLAQIAQGNQ